MISQFYAKKRKVLVNFTKGYVGVEVAEDVVQEVFIRLLQLAEEGKVHFIQNGEVNFFFVYRSCINLCIKLQKQKENLHKLNFGDMYELDEWLRQPENEYNYEEDIAYEQLLNSVKDQVEVIRWYDRMILEINQEMSISEMNRSIGISRDSIRNTLKQAKNEIRTNIQADYEAWQKAKRGGRRD